MSLRTASVWRRRQQLRRYTGGRTQSSAIAPKNEDTFQLREGPIQMWIDKRGVVHSDGRSGDHLLRVELQNGREVRMSLFIFRREKRRRRLMHEEKRSEWKDSRKRTTTVCNISNVKRKCESGVKTASGLHPAVALPFSKGSMPLIHGQGVLMMDCFFAARTTATPDSSQHAA